jgi:nitroreductase
MDAIEAILTRRSIRKYLDKKVEMEIVNLLLYAATSAPSAGNKQPWCFIVVNEREILNKIANVHPHAKMLLEAPLAIVVCADINQDYYPGYWVIDCSASIENMLICARALDLGSVWLGVYPRQDRVEAISRLFSLPANIIPHSIIAVGYTNEEFQKVDRLNLEKVHFNKW